MVFRDQQWEQLICYAETSAWSVVQDILVHKHIYYIDVFAYTFREQHKRKISQLSILLYR